MTRTFVLEGGATVSLRRSPEACSPNDLTGLAHQVLERCDQVSSFTEEPGKIT